MSEANARTPYVSYVYTYFKLEPQTRETRSFGELVQAIADDMKLRWGKDSASDTLTKVFARLIPPSAS